MDAQNEYAENMCSGIKGVGLLGVVKPLRRIMVINILVLLIIMFISVEVAIDNGIKRIKQRALPVISEQLFVVGVCRRTLLNFSFANNF